MQGAPVTPAIIRQHSLQLKGSRHLWKTTKQYGGTEKQWIEFNRIMGNDIPNDFSDENVDLFIAYKNLVHKAGWSACRGAKYAIKAFALNEFRMHIDMTKEKMPACQASLQGIRKLYPPGQNASMTITIEECASYIAHYNNNNLNDQNWRTYWAMKHHGYKRTSELTEDITNNFVLPKLSSIEWYGTNTWKPPITPTIVWFNYDKTKTRAKGSKLFCTYLCQCSTSVCFVHELKQLYLLKHQHFGPLYKEMPIFQFTNNKVITASNSDKEYKKLLISLGLNKKNRSQHGLRKGGIQQAMVQKVPMPIIRQQADVSSDAALKPYTHFEKHTQTKVLKPLYGLNNLN